MWAELCFSQSHCVLLFCNASHLSCLGSAQSRLKQLSYFMFPCCPLTCCICPLYQHISCDAG